MIDRRTFLAGTGVVLLGSPLVAEAQPASRDARAFLDGMRDLGWLDGQNITIERRSVEGQRTPASGRTS